MEFIFFFSFFVHILLTSTYYLLKQTTGMKDFLKMISATLVGLLLFSVISTIITFAILGAMVSMSDIPTKTVENTVFHLKLDGVLSERDPDELTNALQNAFYGNQTALGLEGILSAIKKAEKDNNIKGIYLEIGSFSAPSASTLEIRQALERFKAAGKFVVAYGDSYSNNTYHLASVANKVVLNPSGIMGVTGLAMNAVFFKGTLDKIGVQMQVFKVGTFKSAVEPYISTKMSPENRLQMTVLSNSMWEQICKDIATSRNIDITVINEFANNGDFFADAIKSQELNLVDTLAYKDGMTSIIESYAAKDYKTIKLNAMKKAVDNEKYVADKIAVLYAYGAIDGSERDGINSEKIAEELIKLSENKDVKAVVLRINSPGGSAYGSEQMWHAAEILKAKKPLIVSMGDYAASGGYYMACNADTIVAQPNTLTGSIGIFGIIPNTEKLMGKIGITFDGVKTNELSDFGMTNRPMTKTEQALMQNYVDRGYELFVKRCAEGRGLSVDAIKKIAEGRVWTGTDAQKIGLVDVLGNLDDAIAIAAEKAGLKSYNIKSYPATKDLVTQLTEALSTSVEERWLRSQLGENYQYLTMLRQIEAMYGLQAIMPFMVSAE